MKTCSSCANFAPGEKQCRANPPLAVPFQQQGLAGQNIAVVSAWPPVEPEMWCGQHRQISDDDRIEDRDLVHDIVARANVAEPSTVQVDRGLAALDARRREEAGA